MPGRENSSEYCPTPLKKARFNPSSLGNSLFICQTSQVQSFIDQINETALCYTPHCTGKLVPIEIKQIGLGGGAIIKLSCSQCTERMLSLTSSADISYSKHTICSLAIQVAFIAGGCMYSQYNKILKQHLGILAVNANTFYETIKLLHHIVSSMLNEMCNDAKAEMKAKALTEVGSWQRAITSSDGVWLTRGKFSQNYTFTIRNYTNNSLLYFVHLCMCGKETDTRVNYTKEQQKVLRDMQQELLSQKLKKRVCTLKYSGRTEIHHQQNHFGNISLIR